MHRNIDLRLYYKKETGESFTEQEEIEAHFGRFGDIIIRREDAPTEFQDSVLREGSFTIPGMDYFQWLEDTLQEQLKKEGKI